MDQPNLLGLMVGLPIGQGSCRNMQHQSSSVESSCAFTIVGVASSIKAPTAANNPLMYFSIISSVVFFNFQVTRVNIRHKYFIIIFAEKYAF